MPQNQTQSALSATQIEDLRTRAMDAAQNAYAPYSNFRVGAAVLLGDGNIITGCNIENASFRLTTCAEQSAIATAVCLHGPTIRIRAVVIVNLNHTASQPCGACRQTIHEFGTSTTEVYYPGPGASLNCLTIAELLPSAFLLKSL
jgi:cytidine deaminase